MLLLRPLPPTTRAGRRSAGRRFLLIETRKAKPIVSRYMVADDHRELRKPVVFFIRPTRFEWDDFEFRDVRRVVSAAQAATWALGECSADDESDEYRQAQAVYRDAWEECDMVASHVFTPEAETTRDLFLRAEMLTMHYGDGQISELTESAFPGHRMLGALLQAMWKVGGAANV